MFNEFINVTKQRRLAALYVDGVVIVNIDQGGTYSLSLLEGHEWMFGMICRIDTIKKIAKVAAYVARLPQPHHAAPSNLSRIRFDKAQGWINDCVLVQSQLVYCHFEMSSC